MVALEQAPTLTIPETPFTAFPKIPRLMRDIVITEKIDGTNACVYVTEDGSVHAASRTRWITPEKDNFGFARWVAEHADELRELGSGKHFGEWWGQGIQRGYDLKERRFSLFNRTSWADPDVRPACCDVVPELYSGPFSTIQINFALNWLESHGSFAAPFYPKPEGIVIFHTAAGQMFKRTFEADVTGKERAA